MADRRFVPGALAGLVGLVGALVTIPTHSRVLLVLTAAFTVLSVVLVLTAPDVPLRYPTRRQQRVQRLLRRSQMVPLGAVGVASTSVRSAASIPADVAAWRNRRLG